MKFVFCLKTVLNSLYVGLLVHFALWEIQTDGFSPIKITAATRLSSIDSTFRFGCVFSRFKIVVWRQLKTTTIHVCTHKKKSPWMWIFVRFFFGSKCRKTRNPNLSAVEFLKCLCRSRNEHDFSVCHVNLHGSADFSTFQIKNAA